MFHFSDTIPYSFSDMTPEQSRHERALRYAETLRERLRSGILAELQPLRQWVVWKAEHDREGKQKKAPYSPSVHLRHASVNRPESWGTLDQALTALASGNYSGIGFIITPPLVFIDLDHCYDKITNTITDPQAAAIVQSLNSYTEASPGDGLHILAYGTLPGNNIHTQIEMYGRDRFTTITTRHLANTPVTIEHRQEAIEALYRRFAPAEHTTIFQNTVGGVEAQRLSDLPSEAKDDQVLAQLLNGISLYGDTSVDEYVALMKLMHYTGDNRERTKAIFSSSPIGQRAKAREDTKEGRRGNTTYLDYTLNKIVQTRRNPPMKR